MIGLQEATVGLREAWKVTKRKKGEQRANLGTEKNKKQAAMTAAYSFEKSALHQWANQKAGRLYEEKDIQQFHCKGL